MRLRNLIGLNHEVRTEQYQYHTHTHIHIDRHTYNCNLWNKRKKLTHFQYSGNPTNQNDAKQTAKCFYYLFYMKIRDCDMMFSFQSIQTHIQSIYQGRK